MGVLLLTTFSKADRPHHWMPSLKCKLVCQGRCFHSKQCILDKLFVGRCLVQATGAGHRSGGIQGTVYPPSTPDEAQNSALVRLWSNLVPQNPLPLTILVEIFLPKFYCLLARHLEEGGSAVNESVRESQRHSEAPYAPSNTQIG